jgi:hypothetical protein
MVPDLFTDHRPENGARKMVPGKWCRTYLSHIADYLSENKSGTFL